MDTDKQIAIKGAELLGYPSDVGLQTRNQCTFDPANNANDMNKLIETLGLSIWPIYDAETGNKIIKWLAFCPENIENRDQVPSGEPFTNKSRDEAIRECVIKALGLHNDSEALGVDND